MTMLSKWNPDIIASMEPELKLYICTIYYYSLALLCFSSAQQVFDLRKVVHFYRKLKLHTGQSNDLYLGEANIFYQKMSSTHSSSRSVAWYTLQIWHNISESIKIINEEKMVVSKLIIYRIRSELNCTKMQMLVHGARYCYRILSYYCTHILWSSKCMKWAIFFKLNGPKYIYRMWYMYMKNLNSWQS